jgi:LuxR family maltose regulon positive regulatory protein
MSAKQVALAKLSRPRLHDVLQRTRLHALLDEAAARPIVWLGAQPGAGKTTLVADYLQARKRGGIWYQVDGGDADPASFIYHLGLAEQAYAARKDGDALPLLSPEYFHDLPGFARRFFRELFARLGPDATLVLDNFQEVAEESAFHRLLVEALAQVPPELNVFVLSRSEPPAAYAPLLAGDAIALLEGDALRLSLEETGAIAKKRGVADAAAVEQLHGRSNGWAAGLTLLLARRARQGGGHEDDDAESLQHVFGYFAQRVFDGVPVAQQQALMQLAFLPLVTAELAEQLTGSADIARLLERFYRQHLFTDRRRVAPAGAAAGARHAFQFHALFRTYLQHQAREAYDAAQLRRLLCRAGGLLEAAGHWEQALPLLAEGGDWAAYGRMLAARAESLIEQGRHQTAAEWLERMPQAERERDPWLIYWHGRAQLQGAPDRALALLHSGHARFAAEGNAAGELACGAAVVQTLWYARLGWSEITPWVDRLEPLMNEPVRFPTPAVELLSYAALHAALAFCRLSHPAVPALGRRLLDLLDDEGIDWTQRLFAATHLMTYFHNAAELELAGRLVGKVDAMVEARPSSALSRAYWFIFRAIHDTRRARFEESSSRFLRAEALAREEGLAHAEFAALQFHAYLDTVFRRADDAQSRVERMALHPARGNPDAEMNFWVAQTLLAQLKGENAAALGHAQRAWTAVQQVGAAYFLAMFPAVLASAFADGGQPEAALAMVEQSRTLSRGTYLEVMEAQLLLEEAYIELVRGDAGAARAKLAQGLAVAAADPPRAAYAQRIVARKPVLLVTALQAGIEVEYVRQCIRDWGIPPPGEEVPHWPWPVKVRTLGGFEVLLHDRPIEFGRKAPKKTLALLKAVVARGGSAPDAALIDTFWPDEEGDAAARSLAAAVHRLRGLLGEGDAVQQQGGVVSLDRSKVWVDAWSFERALTESREAGARDTGAATAALALYRGAFLAEEEGESWPVATRERLRSKFIQAVADHATRLEAAKRHQEAIDWYLRGLDADSVVEPFYQGLMRCYHRLDRLPEAVSAYRRLKQTLSVTLSLPPSAATEKLYQALRLG